MQTTESVTSLELEEQLVTLELALKTLEEKEIRYKKENRIAYWEPWPHQNQLLTLLHQGKKTILDQGANRTGKTVFGVNVVSSACLGFQPWDGKDTIWGRQPVRCRIVCVDWEHHAKEVIIPTMYEWLPKGTYETKKNNVGIEAYWYFENGSTVELLTHSQVTKIHEGWKGHLIWADEPMPRDKYSANKRGLVDYEGVFLMTMTAVYESWILDEIVMKNDPSIGVVTDVPMTANPLLSKEAIEDFKNSCPEDEVVPRIHGGWLQLVGLVYKFNKDNHVIDSFNIPLDWPVIATVDFHLKIKQAIGFYAWDKYNREWVIDEIWEFLTPEQIAYAIARKKKKNSWRLKTVLIDPLAKGDTAYLKQRGIEIEDAFSVIERTLRPYNIRLVVASKDKKSGILNVNAALSGAKGESTLKFMRRCERHIWEIQRYTYDQNTDKPKDQDDHFCENLYRSTLAGIKYTNPAIYNKPLEFSDDGIV